MDSLLTEAEKNRALLLQKQTSFWKKDIETKQTRLKEIELGFEAAIRSRSFNYKIPPVYDAGAPTTLSKIQVKSTPLRLTSSPSSCQTPTIDALRAFSRNRPETVTPFRLRAEPRLENVNCTPFKISAKTNALREATNLTVPPSTKKTLKTKPKISKKQKAEQLEPTPQREIDKEAEPLKDHPQQIIILDLEPEEITPAPPVQEISLIPEEETLSTVSESYKDETLKIVMSIAEDDPVEIPIPPQEPIVITDEKVPHISKRLRDKKKQEKAINPPDSDQKETNWTKLARKVREKLAAPKNQDNGQEEKKPKRKRARKESPKRNRKEPNNTEESSGVSFLSGSIVTGSSDQSSLQVTPRCMPSAESSSLVSTQATQATQTTQSNITTDTSASVLDVIRSPTKRSRQSEDGQECVSPKKPRTDNDSDEAEKRKEQERQQKQTLANEIRRMQREKRDREREEKRKEQEKQLADPLADPLLALFESDDSSNFSGPIDLQSPLIWSPNPPDPPKTIFIHNDDYLDNGNLSTFLTSQTRGSEEFRELMRLEFEAEEAISEPLQLESVPTSPEKSSPTTPQKTAQERDRAMMPPPHTPPTKSHSRQIMIPEQRYSLSSPNLSRTPTRTPKTPLTPQLTPSPFRKGCALPTYKGDEDTESSEEDPADVPDWCKGENLKRQLEKQAKTDPDTIFYCPPMSCDLEKIFPQGGKEFVRNKDSGNWSRDKMTVRETMNYKAAMGWL